jgi:DNA-binding transcriptional ArsR family regulator
MAYAYQILDALGDPTRRLVFKRLRGRARSVGRIAERMDVSRPAVSQHLRVLKSAGLVTDRAEGNQRLYAVDREGSRPCAGGWMDSGTKRSSRSKKRPNEKQPKK